VFFLLLSLRLASFSSTSLSRTLYAFVRVVRSVMASSGGLTVPRSMSSAYAAACRGVRPMAIKACVSIDIYYQIQSHFPCGLSHGDFYCEYTIHV
jgi:hypothetical protein